MVIINTFTLLISIFLNISLIIKIFIDGSLAWSHFICSVPSAQHGTGKYLSSLTQASTHLNHNAISAL